MDLTGIAICASLLMAAATVCAFIFAVKKDYFRNIEDTKYQVFWSDMEEMVDFSIPDRKVSAGPPSTPETCPDKEIPHAGGSETSRP